MIALDLSRLLSRAGSATPTGIDRVELTYARHLASGDHPHCYASRNALGGIGLLPGAEATQFITALAELWRHGGEARDRRRITVLARGLRHAALFGGPELRRAMQRAEAAPVYMLASHQNLNRARAITRLKVTTGARFVCLIHDLIPLEFARLTRPGQERRHRRRIATAAALADAVVVNSAATATSLRNWLGPAAPPMPIITAPLGVDLPGISASPAGQRPYFICLGTIEARKNQRLLLDLWPRLSFELGDRAPRLMLIGRRGFGAGAIAGRLSALTGSVIEHGNMPDAAIATLLGGARALLFPSFAEGFGLPVVEALTQGVPVLCSDLPALRESGGGVPDYLDPADAAGWRQAIADYAADSPRRTAQLARLAGWRAPRWDDHFATVGRLIADLR